MNLNYKKLAETLVHYSCKLKKGEKVLIEQSGVPPEFLTTLIEEIAQVGALPFVRNGIPEVGRALMKTMTEERAKLLCEFDLPMMQKMDAYISLAGSDNVFDGSDIPASLNQIYAIHYVKPVHYEERVNNTKWVILRWPNAAFAQSASMSTEKFSDLFFKVCTLDYGKMSVAMDNLVHLMNRTKSVRITAPETDISFSIENIPAIKCDGDHNLPDGEVFTAPVKDSINGVITFNVPTLYNSIRFDNVRLEVENGKIVTASAGSATAKLNEILNTDEGARFFGEFAIGVNPHITQPMMDILFDEKMCGSIHMTPGSCYEEAPNGNDSSIHWDMVLCQLPECGGGEIWFDEVLVRKDGKFILPELECLNPENLI